MKTCCALVVPVPNLGGGGVCAWGESETLAAFNQIVAHFTVLPYFITEIIQLLSLLDSDICHYIKSLFKDSK